MLWRHTVASVCCAAVSGVISIPLFALWPASCPILGGPSQCDPGDDATRVSAGPWSILEGLRSGDAGDNEKRLAGDTAERLLAELGSESGGGSESAPAEPARGGGVDSTILLMCIAWAFGDKVYPWCRNADCARTGVSGILVFGDA